MTIQTAQYINLSDIATVLGVDVDDFSETFTDTYTWGSVDKSLLSLPEFLSQLEVHEEEAVMESLWDIIGTDARDAAKYFVNLAA